MPAYQRGGTCARAGAEASAAARTSGILRIIGAPFGRRHSLASAAPGATCRRRIATRSGRNSFPVAESLTHRQAAFPSPRTDRPDMQPLRRFALAFLALAAFALPARATTYSTDFTDLWFNPAESGWGVNVIQQYNTIFATLFVYGANNAAQWFVAPDVEPSPAGSQTVFTGQLFLTNGPFFGATSFDPASVGKLVVGTITFTFDSATTGTLTYTVNGAPVTKRIQRQTWRNNVLTGNYLGGLTAVGSNCSQVANGPVLIFQTLTVTQSGSNATLDVKFNAFPSGQAAECTFTGPYVQAGKL